MRTNNTTAADTATTPRTRTRKPAPRVEQLLAEQTAATDAPATVDLTEKVLSHADSAIEIAESQPLGNAAPAETPALDPAVAERLAKEEAKLKKIQAEAARRQARIDAYKSGKPIPPAGGKGLPPVVKMNELGALARQLHRAGELIFSDAVQPFATEVGVGHWSVAGDIRKLRDAAMKSWESQYAERVTAGAADNDTLHPLGLVRDEQGRVTLIEKTPAKKSE